MENILNYINPNITSKVVAKHLPHTLIKLQEAILKHDKKHSSVYRPPLIICRDCNNQDQNSFRRHHGDLTCTNCGLIVSSHELTCSYNTLEEADALRLDLFSSQLKFRSYLNGHDRSLKKLNNMVEQMMNSIESVNQTTSNTYKDGHRSKIYSLMDSVYMAGYVGYHAHEKVKKYFHIYRESMTRIHKADLVVCCLYYIVIFNIDVFPEK